MKLSQLTESFVISNDEFEDYLNRTTEQLAQELQSGKNPRDAVHDLALTFADQHNKSYDAYTRMSDSLSARMHALDLAGSTSTDIVPGDGAEMMTDPMGDMEMDVPAEDDMPGDSDMDDYSAVMDNKPEVVAESAGPVDDLVDEMADQLVDELSSQQLVLDELVRYLDRGTVKRFVVYFRRQNGMNKGKMSDQLIHDLVDEVAKTIADELSSHKLVLDELVRYLDKGTVKGFVADFRRNHDLNDDMNEAVGGSDGPVDDLVDEMADQLVDELSSQQLVLDELVRYLGRGTVKRFVQDFRRQNGMASKGGMLSISDLVDEVAKTIADELSSHKLVLDELVRSLSGDQIEEFVADFRRHHDLNDDMNEAVGDSAGPVDDLVDELADQLVDELGAQQLVLDKLGRYLDGGTVKGFVVYFRRQHGMNKGKMSDQLIHDLVDEVAKTVADELSSHELVLDELVRYLDGGIVKRFVADFRRNNDMNDDMEESMNKTVKTKVGESAADEKVRQRAFAKADEPERGEKAKKVSVKKAPWEESVNEAGGYYTKPIYDMIEKHGIDKVMHELLTALDADVIQDALSRMGGALSEASNEVNDDEVRELVLFADNDGDLYSRSTAPIQKNLTKKFVKGTYDHDKAIVLWKYHADRAAKMYGIEHGNNDGFRIFSPAVRKAAAKEFADAWKDELDAGNLHEVAPIVGAVAGGVARAAISKGIKGAVTRAGIKGAANKMSSESVDKRASRIVADAFNEAFTSDVTKKK